MLFILQSSDKVHFQVDKEVLQRSQLLKDMIADIEDHDEPIPISNVNAIVLAKVVEYCKHHRSDPEHSPMDDISCIRKRTDNISEWDLKFMKVDTDVVFGLALAANYLDIKPLLDLTCKTIANMIKGKTSEQIRAEFDLVDDLMPEEKKAIEAETAWAAGR